MKNNFEPINSNMLDDISNFSYEKKMYKPFIKKGVINSSYDTLGRILKAIDGLRAQFNYNGDVSNQSINNSYSLLSEISDVNNYSNSDYKKLVDDFVYKYKKLVPLTPFGSNYYVSQKINLINKIKYDLNKINDMKNTSIKD